VENNFKKKSRTKVLVKRIARIPIVVSILAIIAFFYDFGFEHQPDIKGFLISVYLISIFVGIVSLAVRYFFKGYRPRLKSSPFDFVLFLFLIFILLNQYGYFTNNLPGILNQKIWLYAAVFLVFIREFSALKVELRKAYLNPAQLFVLSFLTLIILGSFLLLLPKATVSGIGLIDALFTSTSAVCVTGLVVVDTGSSFTEFGHIIIALLIQLGGLGIMTFASYFSYFFKGGSSYENQLALRDITNAEKISDVFSILKKIIVLTFLIEGTGALLIFETLDSSVIPSVYDRVFFSGFHAISGFCNAGFSTLQNSFYEDAFQLNYPLHLIISFLIILGGLGFPIVFNLFRYLKLKVITAFLFLLRRKNTITTPRLININTRIVLITSLVLTVLGAVAFYILEYNNTLASHNQIGKVVTAFFGSVTTRTAGFNTVDTGALNLHTILIMMFLMWVGASPASTGGGIKTSTFAVAILNTISIARGKTRLELFNREIPNTSVERAYAIILLSIFVISISILLISFFDSDKGLLNISFECISAYATVGLSRGITADLSSASKLVLTLTMFIGRVSMLTLLIALFKRVSTEAYRLPSENILIN
jgi:potassium uptake TrkH family protein